MQDLADARKKPHSAFARFLGDDDGATAIEYALIAGLLAVAIAASALAVGDNTSAMWNYVRDEIVTVLNR